PLRDIARRTGGVYVPAHSKTVALGGVYLGLIAGRPQREEDEDAVPTSRPRPLWFLLPAFGLLVLAVLVPEGGPRPSGRPAPSPEARPRRPVSEGMRMTARLAGAMTASAVLLLLAAAALPNDPETLLREGDDAYAG